MEKILFEIPHVKLIETDEGKYCLIVESIQLNDYIEDLLWDHYQYDSTSIAMEHRSAVPVYSNYFDAGVVIEDVIGILQEIDPKELEKINISK